MRTILIAGLGIALSAVSARAQESAPGEPLPRLSELRIALERAVLNGETGPIRQLAQPVEQDDPEPDDGGRDSLRNGTLTGLVVGGVVGLVLAARCGHPECGMFVSFCAGIGAAVGVAIDAMFTNRPSLVPERTRTRRPPFDRAVAVGVRKTW